MQRPRSIQQSSEVADAGPRGRGDRCNASLGLPPGARRKLWLLIMMSAIFLAFLLPYLLMPAVALMALRANVSHGDEHLEFGVYICSAILIGLVLFRQVLALLENRRLFEQLGEAYTSLDATNKQTVEYANGLEEANAALDSMRIELQDKNRDLAAANAVLEGQATTDGMTGLANHRAFQERLRAEIDRAVRNDRPLALILLDIDRFKHYNDTYGHPEGDLVLKRVAELARESVRDMDMVARYGGEEFAVILPEADSESAMEAAERIRQQVENSARPDRGITVSLGVAERALAGNDPKGLITAADVALYAAKKMGRNRAVFTSGCTDSQDAGGERYMERVSLQAAAAREWDPRPTQSQGYGGWDGLIQDSSGRVLSSLMMLLEVREGRRAGHSQRVVRFALRLAMQLEARGTGLDPGEMRELAIGALLHDIGKLGVAEAILLKGGHLDAYEQSEVRRHPEYGAQLAQYFEVFQPGLPVILGHHERWDGAGYPRGLAGEAIPRTARVFAVADALDAMLVDRPFRGSMSYYEVRDEILRHSGRQFDPEVSSAFAEISPAEWSILGMTHITESELLVSGHEIVQRKAA